MKIHWLFWRREEGALNMHANATVTAANLPDALISSSINLDALHQEREQLRRECASETALELARLELTLLARRAEKISNGDPST
mgnify:CR=1 FL=1